MYAVIKDRETDDSVALTVNANTTSITTDTVEYLVDTTNSTTRHCDDPSEKPANAEAVSAETVSAKAENADAVSADAESADAGSADAAVDDWVDYARIRL